MQANVEVHFRWSIHAGSRTIGRREFIRSGALAGLGVGLATLPRSAAASIPPTPQVRRYAALGRTGMKISDISFGADRLSPGQEDLVRHALDLGINYFDTAETYRGGDSEITLGKALRGKRDKVFLTSKSLAGPDTEKDAIMRALEGSLRRLQTDHVDVYFNHAVNELRGLRIRNGTSSSTRRRSRARFASPGCRATPAT